ncbi:MAG TPA: hypothetical protein VNT99_04695 [Methylomirabilota bacterium]|nr:hypothetical protein [Methylomirabilota bacterium]
MRLNYLLLVLLLAAGCATRSPQPSSRPSFPGDALITQRAVLTARGKQFTLNGYLSMSQTGGKRLLVTENFGNVLADVLVKPDGAVHVMRSSSAFRPAHIKRFVAADLECAFGNPKKKCRLDVLSPTHFVVKRFWYKLDLRIVDVKPGPQPAGMFDETQAMP